MKKNKETKKSRKVVKGVSPPSTFNPALKKILQQKRKKRYSAKELFEALKKGDKSALSQAITLIESTQPATQQVANHLLEMCFPLSGQSIRIGITGSPGVGKSTFIEAFGNYLLAQHKKVAVLAIDPSSEISSGSILGDKTRMESLASQPHAFVRPSPAQSTLGGVARKTRETIILCEAAGFDTILIETVGVGQSETMVHSMVDFFVLLLLPGAGDELQGIKRGIVEMADIIVINKADKSRQKLAEQTRRDYQNALHLFPAKKSGWQPKVLTASALEKKGVASLWEHTEKYFLQTKQNDYFYHRRKEQATYWLTTTMEQELLNYFYQNEKVQQALPKLEKAVKLFHLSPFQAARELLTIFKK